jgi:hypothetical protein
VGAGNWSVPSTLAFGTSSRNDSVSAIPLGKRSCSTLIICRFIGIAMVTPSTASRNTHASMSGSASVVWLTSMYAAKAEMSVPPVE